MCSSFAADMSGFNKSVSFSYGAIYFYVRLVVEGQYLRAVVFFPFSPH